MHMMHMQAHGGNDPIIPFSGAFENEVSELGTDEEKEAFYKSQGATSVLPKIVTTGFKAIHLIYFFTAGADEVKCWQIRKGTKAPGVRMPQLQTQLVYAAGSAVCSHCHV